MIEFLTQPWMILIETIAGFLAMFYIPGLRFIAKAILKAVLSRVVLEQFFIEIAEKLALSTETKVDDKLVAQIKLALRK